jgi:hypothetical protein
LFLPVELTAQPCLSARVNAPSARITAVLTPRRNGLPVLTSAMLVATGGIAVQVQGNGFTDAYLIRTDIAGIVAGDIRCNGTENLVRKQGGEPVLAMTTRGTSLVASSKLILRTGHPANLAWRGIIGGAVVEAEPPYKDNGGNDTIRIGGLTVGKNYSVSMDGSAAGVATADSGGTAAVGVNLTTRIVIRLTELNGVIKRSFPGPQSFSFHMRHIPGGIDFTFDGPFGRAISLQICDLQGRTIWSWPGREGPAPSSRIVWTGVDRSGRPASTGVYLVKILGRADFQSALFVYLR